MSGKTVCGSSNNQILKFVFEEKTSDISVSVVDGGDVWFVAKDICDALGYGNSRQALASHVDSDDVQKLDVIDSLKRTQQINVINESGVFALIFGSKLPAAKAMKKWVTGEVLPSIRKTGSYGIARIDLDDPAYLAALISQSAAKIVELKAEADAAKLALEDARPAIEFTEAVKQAPDAIDVGRAAKVIGTGRTRMFEYLRQIGWVTRYNQPYQCKIEAGYLNVKVSQWEHPRQGLKESITTLITGKGLQKLREMWTRDHTTEQGVAGSVG